MNTTEIFDTSTSSSAISNIKVHYVDNIVEIIYNSNTEKSYEFHTDDPEYVSSKVHETLSNNESIGKLIHQLKNEQVLENLLN